MTSALANELREAILPAIAGSEEVEIDLSQVSAIDYAGVLLMMEAKLEADVHGRELRFVGYSRPVLEILALCNMGRFFGAPVLFGTILH